jgi:hypothetical protein
MAIIGLISLQNGGSLAFVANPARFSGPLRSAEAFSAMRLKSAGTDSLDDDAWDDLSPVSEFGNHDSTFHAFQSETLSLLYEKSMERMDFFPTSENKAT